MMDLFNNDEEAPAIKKMSTNVLLHTLANNKILSVPPVNLFLQII